MSKDIHDFVTPSCDLLAYGEPTHLEPAFAWLRNELFDQLADRGFRSIALETDQVAALTVNDFVQEGVGTLDTAMTEGFSHTFGELETNRHLVAWMREYNETRPTEERLAFHGFDAPMETMSAPSPRPYFEHARDYLNLDHDLTSLTGDDEQWSRTEAIMDPAMSIGATAEAETLRSIADDMLTLLYARAPERIAATSRAEWFRARTHLTAGLGLLRYHKQSAQHLDQTTRVTRLCALRDSLMAQNLLDLRDIEAERGPTLIFAHNRHLQRNRGHMRMGDMELEWFSAGAIVESLVGQRYTFIAGSLGASQAIALGEPEADTYEGFLQSRFSSWGLTRPARSLPPAPAPTLTRCRATSRSNRQTSAGPTRYSTSTPARSEHGRYRKDVTIAEDLAPTGVLRAAINLGNPVLARGTPDDPGGVTVDIAREIAARIEVPVELRCFDAARKSFAALTSGDADRPGVRIGVKKGSAYDLFLTRTLRHATVVRGDEGVDVFRAEGLEVAAGIREPMTEFVADNPDTRLIAERFMAIRQAVGTTRDRRPEAVSFLRELVAELKARGFVAKSMGG